MINALQKALSVYNNRLKEKTPYEIITWVYQFARNPLASTSFGTYSAALLHVCTRVDPQIPVIWCDTGYNTPATYRHANELIRSLSLNIDIYTPQLTTAFIEHKVGQPDINNPQHTWFAEQVKLEPFARALRAHRPDVWFTNLRKEKTLFRDTLDILSFSSDGILKVSPFYHFSDTELLHYLEEHQLPLEPDYYDPVKALEHRECGIHFLK